MKKTLVLTMVLMLTVLVSASMAGDDRMGKLFLFQKCDADLKGTNGYDASGCPTAGNGPWPALLNGPEGKMEYSIVGEKFGFSFKGKKLSPKTGYTLIYYPDPWPGTGSICLASESADAYGNIALSGIMAITDGHGNPSGLPVKYDANYNPASPSGAVGAKIWLVLSSDMACTDDVSTTSLVAWNPSEYLFEDNLIVYQRSENEPPKIKNASASPSVIWPPNHKMVGVTVNYCVTDDTTPPKDIKCALGVTSNESISSSDYIIVDSHHVKLRAERLGEGSGRIYTITIACTDDGGLSASKDVTVTVPHDKGKKK